MSDKIQILNDRIQMQLDLNVELQVEQNILLEMIENQEDVSTINHQKGEIQHIKNLMQELGFNYQ